MRSWKTTRRGIDRGICLRAGILSAREKIIRRGARIMDITELKYEFITAGEPDKGRSDSGRYAVLTKGRKSFLFNAEERGIIAAFPYSIHTCCFDAEEKTLFSLEFNGTLHIYDLIGKREVFKKKIVGRGFACESGIAVRRNEIYCVGYKNGRFVRFCYRPDADTTERELMSGRGSVVGTYKDMVICEHIPEAKYSLSDRFTLLYPDGSERVWCEYNRSSSCYHGGALYSISDFGEGNILHIDYPDGREKRQILLPYTEKGFRFWGATFDTDGRYLAFASNEKTRSGNRRAVCYDMQTKTVIYREEWKDLYSVAVLKNGFLYGGFTKSRFVGFEELGIMGKLSPLES